MHTRTNPAHTVGRIDAPCSLHCHNRGQSSPGVQSEVELEVVVGSGAVGSSTPPHPRSVRFCQSRVWPPRLFRCLQAHRAQSLGWPDLLAHALPPEAGPSGPLRAHRRWSRRWGGGRAVTICAGHASDYGAWVRALNTVQRSTKIGDSALPTNSCHLCLMN